MHSLDGIFDVAANDREHGAAEIERRLIDGLLRDRKRWAGDDLDRGAALLLARQPAMALVSDRLAE